MLQKVTVLCSKTLISIFSIVLLVHFCKETRILALLTLYYYPGSFHSDGVRATRHTKINTQMLLFHHASHNMVQKKM
jgi:hypothetical protein